MEYFWLIVAALGAGVGTGLAGLSAATVMVPILLVLCPSFQNPNGAYQATAIALASDILASAFTTCIYIRHKHIDLKRGWIMLACIVFMCIVGSYVAYQAGNQVLGGFTLFLTFCIGIRFLVKPASDQEEEEKESREKRLGLKGVLISLFFGLTIGFGTGFVGTGGGMMMLVVFTMFLSMPYKDAVGTSTFIMTFTALIASVSHILIEPSIVLDCWGQLLTCISVATVSSIVSARYANRVDARKVSLATGIVLTILGAAMIYLNYKDWFDSLPFLAGIERCALEFLEYIGIGACLLLLLRAFVPVKPYVFRKLLHLVAFTSLLEMLLEANTWLEASATSLLFAAVVYPILLILEKYDWYGLLFVEKKKGEVKLSLALLFGMAAFLFAFAWGFLHKKYIAAAAILMWGAGDGAAALIGIPWGKHKIKSRFADGKKSWEGTLAMFFTSLACGMLIFTLYSPFGWLQNLLIVLPCAALGAATELVSRKGNDTFTVPLAITFLMALLCL